MIEVRHLTIGYGTSPLVKDISFEIGRDEFVLLSGANGTGKSTLMRTLSGILPPLKGSIGPFRAVLIPTGIPKVRGFTMAEFIRTGCYAETDWKGAFPPERERKMQEAADLLGIGNLLGRDISSLSDGEFQLACVATGMTRQCDWLLLDEPTAFLDVDNRVMVLQALKRIASETPVLFSSHDILDAMPIADRIFAITPERTFLSSGSDSFSKDAVLRQAFRSFNR